MLCKQFLSLSLSLSLPIYIYTYIYIYIYICVCIYICIYICACAYSIFHASMDLRSVQVTVDAHSAVELSSTLHCVGMHAKALRPCSADFQSAECSEAEQTVHMCNNSYMCV